MLRPNPSLEMRARQGKKVKRMTVKIGGGKEIKGMRIREAKEIKSKKMKKGRS